MSWKLVLFEKVKPHIITPELCKDILDELYNRFLDTPFEKLDKDKAWFDAGGMAMMDEEWLTWTLPGGLNFTTRVSHFEYAFEQLKELQLREVNGKKYYKLHGWLHAIVMTEEQRNFLLEDWNKNYQNYLDKATMANLEFERRLAEVNKDSVKIVHKPRIEIPKDKN